MTIQETLIDFIQNSPKSKYALLSKLADELDDKMLWEIAEADYGFGADECFVDLKNIQLTKEINSVSIRLNEVISLTRWLEAETKEEHLKRAFSCVCVLIEETIKGSFAHSMGMSEGGLAGLMGSIIFLGDEYIELASQFINWRIFYEYELEEAGFDDDCEPYTLDELYIDDVFIAVWLYCLLLEQKEEEEIIILVDWLFQEAKLITDLYELTLVTDESYASVQPQLWQKIKEHVLNVTLKHYEKKEVHSLLVVFMNATLSNDISEMQKVRKENGINI